MPSNTPKKAPEKPVKEKKGHGSAITIFSSLILAVIVVTFIGAPVVTKVSEQNPVVFGNYDGVPIEFVQGNAFSRQVEQLSRFYDQFNQGNNSKDAIDQQRRFVWRQAFQQTALRTALKKEAETAGIVVTEKQIDQSLVSHPAYQKDGRFSDEIYRNTNASDKFRYRQDTREDILVRTFVNDHTDAVMVSQKTQDFVAQMAFPQRKFSFIVFNDVDYPDSLISEYLVKNKNLFRTINLSRITIEGSESDAQKVRDQAVKNEKSFEDLAKASSKDALAATGGALNTRSYADLKTEFDKVEDLDKVFALKKAEISNVIKRGNTWTIYKVVDAAADADVKSPSALATARLYMTRNDRGVLEDYLEKTAKDFKSKVTAATFAAEAKKLNKTVESTNFVALNFGNLDLFTKINTASQNNAFQALSANEDFFKKAFKLAKDGISDPILASPNVIVVKVDEIKDKAAKPEEEFNKSTLDSTLKNERQNVFQQTFLDSPKLKDDFNTEFEKLFRE